MHVCVCVCLCVKNLFAQTSVNKNEIPTLIQYSKTVHSLLIKFEFNRITNQINLPYKQIDQISEGHVCQYIQGGTYTYRQYSVAKGVLRAAQGNPYHRDAVLDWKNCANSSG